MATKRMNRRTMGNDWGGRRAENPVDVPRVSREQVLSAAAGASVQVKRESVGWCMWWVLRPGDVWRTLATTNYKAVQELQKSIYTEGKQKWHLQKNMRTRLSES